MIAGLPTSFERTLGTRPYYRSTYVFVQRRDRPEHVHVVITGRDAPESIVEIADTVTEMRMVKHAYQRGIVAKKGIEY